MRFIKFSTLVFFLFLCSKVFGQTNKKINPNPVAVALINKVIKNSNILVLNGGHKTGNLYGESIFNFFDFTSQYPIINITTTLENYGRNREEGMLRNFRFQNSGGPFNTKIILADWGTSNNTKYGMFEFYLAEDKNEIVIAIFGKSNWMHSARIPLSVKQYQELVNQLTISGSPINIINERVKKQVRDSIENAKKDSILKVEMTVNPIKINDFFVAKKDFRNFKNWQQAKEACEKLGKGWRLPRIQDLIAIRKYHALNGSLKGIEYQCNYPYWSSTNYGLDTSQAMFLDICSAYSDRYPERFLETIKNSHTKKSEDSKLFVLAIWSPYSDNQRDSIERVAFVRDSTQKAKDSIAVVEKINREIEAKRIEKETFNKGIIGQPILFNGLLVAQFDFPNNMNLEDAKKACKNLGDGWRLPTEAELNLIFKERKELNNSNFEFEKYYWCSDTVFVESHYDRAAMRTFPDVVYYLAVFLNSNGKSKTYRTDEFKSEYKIRAVKTQ